MKRPRQLLLIGAMLALSWLAMQVVHELGHVIGAAASGGRVGAVVLHPTTISYTRLTANPHPLFVAWMGPIVGATLPLVTLAVVRAARLPGWFLLQFFAGFCLLANGAYVVAGSVYRAGDADDMLTHGAPVWLLWMFGLVTIPIGLRLWNGLGSYFGIGSCPREVTPTTVYVVGALLMVTIAVELAISSRA